MSTIKISQLTPATLPLAGTEVLPIVQANETRKASIAALSSFANVKAYGAIGDGVTDDTAAIQSCVNANDGVFFPSGTYKVSSAISLKTNSTVFGEGASSVILYAGTAASQGALYVNSGGASAYVSNITVQDLKLLGQVSSLGFNEFIHLISFNGVKNCVIERCVIEGFRGDGIYIGSGDVAAQERHNIDVTIRDCYIDGVNKDNRNGISVIDCDGMNIDNNYITRTTRSNMPGAIDIEPDANAYHVVRDISVRNNKIVDCGGNVAAIGVFLPYVAYTTWPTGFNIENNFVDTPSAPSDNLYGIFFQYGSPFTSPPNPVVFDGQNDFAVRVANNVVRFPAIGPGRGFVMWNCNNVVMTDNTFSGGSSSFIGYVNANVVDFTLANNQFTSVNGSGDYAVTVFSAQRLNIINNVFKDCGGVSGAARGAILFTAGNRITNSDFATDTDWTKGTGWSIAAGVATKSAGTGSNLSQSVSIAQYGTYQLTYTITRSAGSITPRLVGSTTVTGTARSASGTYTETLTAPAGSVTFELVADASFAGTVDNVYLWSGSSSYVRINGNTFTSPNGTYTQQAVTYDAHTFDRGSNTFLNNAVLAGTNAFEALQYDNTNGIGFNSSPAATTRINVGGTLPSSGTVSLPVVVDGTIPSSTTATGAMYRTAPTTEAASFTLTNLQHYQATQGTLGAGSAVSNQFGFVADSSLTGATNNFGFYGGIAAGANRYNFYGAGTAANYFAGGVEVASGTTTMTAGFTHIPAAAGAPTGVPTNPSGNVPMYYDTTNNKIYVYNGGWKATAALT